MPISAAGSKPRRRGERGFTLVELMVVVTVIALASAVALWAMPDPRGRVTDEAGRFAARVKAARDLAIVEARPVSVWATGGGYGFDRRLAGSWVPMNDKPLRLERWSEGTRAVMGDSGGRSRVTFDETGFADRPFELVLTRKNARASVRLESNGSVKVGA